MDKGNSPMAENERQGFKWTGNFLMLREEECGNQIEGHCSAETKNSVHNAEGLLGSRTVSGLSSSHLGKDTVHFATRKDIKLKHAGENRS